MASAFRGRAWSDVRCRLRDAARERKRDDSRKARIGGRLLHLVRQDDEAAQHQLDQILEHLQEGDRPLFKGWSAKPAPEPVVTISDRHRPRTLAEIDAEIERMSRHLEDPRPRGATTVEEIEQLDCRGRGRDVNPACGRLLRSAPAFRVNRSRSEESLETRTAERRPAPDR